MGNGVLHHEVSVSYQLYFFLFVYFEILMADFVFEEKND